MMLLSGTAKSGMDLLSRYREHRRIPLWKCPPVSPAPHLLPAYNSLPPVAFSAKQVYRGICLRVTADLDNLLAHGRKSQLLEVTVDFPIPPFP